MVSFCKVAGCGSATPQTQVKTAPSQVFVRLFSVSFKPETDQNSLELRLRIDIHTYTQTSSSETINRSKILDPKVSGSEDESGSNEFVRYLRNTPFGSAEGAVQKATGEPAAVPLHALWPAACPLPCGPPVLGHWVLSLAICMAMAIYIWLYTYVAIYIGLYIDMVLAQLGHARMVLAHSSTSVCSRGVCDPHPTPPI